MPRVSRYRGLLSSMMAVALAACAVAPAGRAPGGAVEPSEQASEPQRTKSITVGLTGQAQALSVMSAPTTSGGWQTMNEIHSAGLITSDVHTRRAIGRLAEKVPSLDDDSISLLPDGRMRVVYALRRDVRWQDGAPFSAEDLAFSHRLNSDGGVPTNQRDTIQHIHSVEALDPYTFVINYQSLYFLGGTIGLREFWPHPRHILGGPYERYLATKNPDEVVNLRYWTSEYLHLGPFRLESFDPGEGSVYRAFDGYFLGRPKIDVVRVRTFPDPNTLFANLLAGTVDIFADSALSTELGFQLKDRWDGSGEGTVYVRDGFTRFLAPQWRPAVQTEPTIFDIRVRAALYQAIDREALSEREMAAWSLLPPSDRLYAATKDGFRRYPYDPDRAKAMLREVGWIQGSDGAFRHSADGRRLRVSIWNTPGGRSWETPVYADYWRRIGLEAQEFTIPAPQVRNLEFRASYPNFEASSSGPGDSTIDRIEGPPASAATRWVGDRGGYEDHRARELIRRYRTSLAERDQLRAMEAISEFVAAELPLLIFYYTADHIGVRKGIKALDDVNGGAIPTTPPFGTYTRNAHLWDVP